MGLAGHVTQLHRVRQCNVRVARVEFTNVASMITFRFVIREQPASIYSLARGSTLHQCPLVSRSKKMLKDRPFGVLEQRHRNLSGQKAAIW